MVPPGGSQCESAVETSRERGRIGNGTWDCSCMPRGAISDKDCRVPGWLEVEVVFWPRELVGGLAAEGGLGLGLGGLCRGLAGSWPLATVGGLAHPLETRPLTLHSH